MARKLSKYPIFKVYCLSFHLVILQSLVKSHGDMNDDADAIPYEWKLPFSLGICGLLSAQHSKPVILKPSRVFKTSQPSLMLQVLNLFLKNFYFELVNFKIIKNLYSY